MKIKKIKIILSIFLLTIGHSIFACDCESQGDFFKVASKTKLVALVKITRYLTFDVIDDVKTPISMEVEIIEIYKGKESRKKVIVWGDNGFLCRPYLSRFDEGKHYIIAFNETSSKPKKSEEIEKPMEYSISICGEYWLNIDLKKQIATGSLTKKKINFKAFKRKIKNYR